MVVERAQEKEVVEVAERAEVVEVAEVVKTRGPVIGLVRNVKRTFSRLKILVSNALRRSLPMPRVAINHRPTWSSSWRLSTSGQVNIRVRETAPGLGTPGHMYRVHV